MQLFYVPDIAGNEVILNETESKHAVKVLRLSEGDSVQLIDGKGGFYEAEISDAHPKKCRLKITRSENEFGKRSFRLHIAIAPTKNTDRFEWFLEKATEIGINEITPLLCERSERKMLKTDRLEKILVSAMKQSVKAYLPRLNELTPFKDFVSNCKSKFRYIAHCEDSEKIFLKNEPLKNQDILILIGPEGDFSPEEIEFARQHAFQEITLGDSRLRTETAGVVACTVVNIINQ